MQLRDNKQGIFFPGFWGLFGGGIDAGETAVDALRRELREELGLNTDELRPLSRLDFDFAPMGGSHIYRAYFELQLPASSVSALRLGEGAGMEFFSRDQMLALPRLAPYDAFVLWFHANKYRLHTAH